MNAKKSKMYHYLLMRKGICLLFFILLTLKGAGGSLFALVMSSLVDCAGKNTVQLSSTLLGSVLFVTVLICLEILFYYLKAGILAKARYHLKKDLFSGIMSRNVSDFDASGSAEYINELTNNVNLLESTYFVNLISALESLVSFASAAVICLMIQPVMLVLMVLLALAARAVSRLSSGSLEKSMKKQVECVEAYTAEIQDDFGGFRLIRSYGVLPYILTKYAGKNRAAEDAKRRNANCRMFCIEAGAFTGLLSTVLVMGLAAYFSIKGMISAGMVIAFGHLIGHIVSPITSLPSLIANFAAAKPLLERFGALLEEREPVDGEELKDFGQAVALESLSFGYEKGQDVLQNLSFRFEAGKHYVVTGQSGSGKSTLLSLLSGYYPDYGGSISIDGRQLRKISQESLSALVGTVSQDTFLFQDTIQNNISLYDERYGTSEIAAAIEQAGLKDLVDSLPQGLSTPVTERGKNFSGGERQRISLARALLRNSRILLLDEFTANLDRETAEKIESEVLSRTDCLTITVTHHLSPDMERRYDGHLKLEKAEL